MNRTESILKKQKTNEKKQLIQRITVNWELYLLIAIPVIYIIIFKYLPMYGTQIAFRKYSVTKGIFGSPWVGLEHFGNFIRSYNFSGLFLNTLILSLYQLIAGFPVPIILALSLNYCKNKIFKKTVQMATYAPYFISVVVISGLILQILALRTGIVNNILDFLGFGRVDFIGKPELFSSIYVWSGIWQNAGWGSIIYLAALAGVDPELHEAAIVDGANKFQRVRFIDIPCILPTTIILLILNFGRILHVGFQKVLLLQNSLNKSSSEIIQTYVYKIGLASAVPNYSYASAVGLFTAVISLIMILIVNKIAKHVSETSLW